MSEVPQSNKEEQDLAAIRKAFVDFLKGADKEIDENTTLEALVRNPDLKRLIGYARMQLDSDLQQVYKRKFPDADS